VLNQNVSLKQQLAELKQRYSRLKQAMKAARERLDANSQKKEEVLSSRRGWKNDEAIIEQSKYCGVRSLAARNSVLVMTDLSKVQTGARSGKGLVLLT
jgi:hypothetical protein